MRYPSPPDPDPSPPSKSSEKNFSSAFSTIAFCVSWTIFDEKRTFQRLRHPKLSDSVGKEGQPPAGSQTPPSPSSSALTRPCPFPGVRKQWSGRHAFQQILFTWAGLSAVRSVSRHDAPSRSHLLHPAARASAASPLPASQQDQDLEAATARVQALEAQLREAEVETDGKRGEWDEERNRMMVSSSEQRRENRRLAEQLASAEAERESQHKAAGEQLEEQAQRIVGLMMENREHAARAKSLEQENAALRTCVERLEPDLQGSQTEAAELKDRNRDLEVRIAALKSNAESTDAATQRLEQLCQQLEVCAVLCADACLATGVVLSGP